MEFPADLKYTKDHEWIRLEGGTATVGITEFAQSELGELVFVDLPQSGRALKPGETLAVVESTKAASDVYAPVAGTVAEANAELADTPSLVNTDPYNKGWLIKMTGVDEKSVAGLMNADQYREHLGGRV